MLVIKLGMIKMAKIILKVEHSRQKLYDSSTKELHDLMDILLKIQNRVKSELILRGDY